VEILREIGYSADRIDDLVASRAAR